MPARVCRMMNAAFLAGIIACAFSSGCSFSVNLGQTPGNMPAAPPDVPRENGKKTLDYVIEPPDIVVVQALRALPDKPLSAEKLVRTDGTIDLEYYGSVRIAGLTIEAARQVVEEHLAAYIRKPQVRLDVFAYNSKYYYVLADGAGFGEQAVRLAYTGNETVIDAITQIGGLPPVSSKKRIWVSRPGPPGGKGCVLPVDWIAITQCGDSTTNYQILPGDRVYIQADPLIALDGFVSKVFAPIERTFGVTLLGATTIKQLQNMGRTSGQGGLGGF